MQLSLSARRPVAALVMFVAGLWLMPSMVAAQQKYIVQPIAEMKVKQLPILDRECSLGDEALPVRKIIKMAAAQGILQQKREVSGRARTKKSAGNSLVYSGGCKIESFLKPKSSRS